jgi:4'-phosphopantetheinyl transferase
MAVTAAHLNFVFHESTALLTHAQPAALGEHDVHVWQGPLNHYPQDKVSRLETILSGDEKERAARFRFEKNRKEFIVTRGWLRMLLGQYLGVSPAQLAFAYSAHGKPSIGVPATAPLHFNVSHTDGMGVFAFAWNRRVGIDIEKPREEVNVEELAGRFYSSAEKQAIRELPPEDRREAFFRCWTRKEAYIKAIGEGLSHPLHQFDVSLAPGDQAALLCTRPDATEASRWVLRDVPTAPGYIAALAVEVNSERNVGTAVQSRDGVSR